VKKKRPTADSES